MDISEALGGLAQRILMLLPTSPFRPFVDQFAALPGLGVLNWFFPVSECLVVLGAWLSAIAVFLLYSVIMRWVKLIAD